MSITWARALSWRLQQQLLDPVGDVSVAEVVRRLGAVPAKEERLAELTVRLRRTHSRPGEVAAALVEGSLVKAYAFRGGTHYLTPEDGGAYLTVRAAGRQWERRSWQEYYRLGPMDWPAFRAAVREALADGPLTVAELGSAVTRRSAYRHLRPVFDEGAVTLSKALTWQGDMGFGPPREGRATFQRLDADPRWVGTWELAEAGPHVVRAYLHAYGPATPEHVHYWLGGGLSAGRRRIDGWLAELRDRLEPVAVGGETAYVLAEDADSLRAAEPTDALRLLPGHDPWVMGPGTNDEHVVPPDLRTAVTRGADLVVRGGVVCGTWSVVRDELRVAWGPDHGSPPRTALDDEAARLAGVLGKPLEPVVTTG
ncbi:DNA glycosylase AlkZ-like family protein [Terracoccus sp. 273MFTsu3.1]|uniref:DNA glycosylase AlkZ-like family protein n=1 Tax=Terracoccus sp. 273MFTsu3.1 TaxID=1172188 RepID=UPI000380101E|nr:crosslink repair DNA glycosylase YcaQ family protein [Terracoccus sp. 273MFTsu3.1]